MFLNNACNPAASAVLFAGKVKKDNAEIGTNATETPKQRIKFGIIILCIDAVVFKQDSIKQATAIIINPIAVSSLFSTSFAISPIISNPNKQTIALGNINKPDADGL